MENNRLKEKKKKQKKTTTSLRSLHLDWTKCYSLSLDL